METVADILARLPLDLLLSVVELSDCPTTTYIQLLGLTHAVRGAIIGTARLLSFGGPPEAEEGEIEVARPPPPPAVTLEALEALVRPCGKGLLKLALWGQDIPLLETGTEFECAAWVARAFGPPPKTTTATPTTTTGLAALCVSMGPLPLVLMRGGYLGGLEELRLEPGDYPALGRVLEALGRGACPRLRSLQIMGLQPGFGSDWAAALGPLAGTLRELILPQIWRPHRLADFLPHCAALERVSLVAACDGAMGALAAHLTQLTLHLEGDLTGMGGLCRRLESLDVPIRCPGLAALLAANGPTLRALTLRGRSDLSESRSDLWATALPASPAGPMLDAATAATAVPQPLLGPALLDRLERLCLLGSSTLIPYSVYIASARLRRLDMGELRMCGPRILDLRCPALEEVALPMTVGPSQYRLRADCPKMRSLRIPSLRHLEPPGAKQWTAQEILPLVHTGADRLTELAGVMLDPPEVLSQLGALRRLTLPLPKSLGCALVRRLPPHVEQLTVTLYPGGAPSSLEVDGPGLRAVTILGACYYAAQGSRLTLRCPALAALRLFGDEILAFDLLGPEEAAPLRSLSVDCCPGMGEASLLACLTRHGARLRQVTLRVGPTGWSQRVAGALERLPVLTQLTLGEAGPDLVLACPRLRQLAVCPLHLSTPLCSLTLDCPLLEDLQAPFAALTRVDMAGPPPGLRRIGGVQRYLAEERALRLLAGVHLDPVGARAMLLMSPR
ncbi:hypothetical protein PAPYR_4840 [Paratrimastix pyriformis]|uniref:Uncharacterized protein n=1 Tax=Paratrimastix pyriformis TaxID=342808 RepID=A0ABQ8ULG9_9EUKA|nr:hypothetical protein PAPYR_4840 [Paratrimastix pyriformis]